MKEQGLLDLLNAAIQTLEPITYDKLNVVLYARSEDSLEELERVNNKLGITKRDGKTVMTTLSLIATITDQLCGKRLAFSFSDDGILTGVEWYQ